MTTESADKPRVLMLVMTEVLHDARVRREAGSLADAGFDVGIIGLGPSRDTEADGARIHLVPASSGFETERDLKAIGRSIRWWLLPLHRARSEAAFRRAVITEGLQHDAAVIHAHDLNTLEAAAALATHFGAKLVYDSHECWTERARVGRPSPLRHRREAALEKRLGSSADAVIASGPGVARWLRSARGFDDITVVRNTFPFDASAGNRPPTRPGRLVYAGRIGPGRDLQTLAAAAGRLPIAPLIIGTRASAFRLPGPLETMPAVDIQVLTGLIRSAGLALVSLEDSCLNHRRALPNKLFHTVQAGVPVVAADLPEIRDLVQRHRIGTLYTPGDAHSLAEAVHEAVRNYGELVDSVVTAAPELSWDVDERALLDLYTRLAPPDTTERPV